MSMSPFEDGAIESEQEQLTVQRTDFAPIEKKDSPSAWRNFFNGVRNLFGFKSIELAERFAEARATKEEYANDATMLQARADYELKMAEAKKLRSEAKKIEVETEVIANKNFDSLVAELLKKHSPDEAEQKVLDIIKRIELENGGCVEFDSGDPPKTDVVVEVPPLKINVSINTPPAVETHRPPTEKKDDA
ncbi:hypothetical protein FYZ48_28680 [Gimesia chilikensis]|uniref:hypothetical protein n=1 Tax=Gimesia chilikensis TaxID=2605989 RepID=UPI0011EC0524|nr:hypothetical protein [Gimesia chilikensis]KAA0132092.1 hypothetical protein FYZ48_28680 [Gimesia chilikensis]